MNPRRTKIEKREEESRRSRLLMKVEVYLNYNLWKQANAAVDELLALEPDLLEGHELRLNIAERSGDRDAAVRQLVTMAKLTENEPGTANRYLQRAIQRGDEPQVRALATELGLPLNNVLRVSSQDDEAPPHPTEWPFAGDDLSVRWCSLRRLRDPAELRLISHPDDEPGAFGAIARNLAAIALNFRADDLPRQFLFIDPDLSYGVFTTEHYVAVHEYTATQLGRIAGRLLRMAQEQSG